METTQELAWLRFNRRVLEQTKRPDFPVLERLRFLAIWASNLDEFFAARVARLFLQGRGTEEYAAVLREAHEQAELAARAYDDFQLLFARLGIRILSSQELTLEEKRYFGAYLAEEIAPRTDVIRADAVRDMRSQALYFASGAAAPTSIVRMPDGMPRLLEVPGRPRSYVRLGELLRLRPDLFLTGKNTRLHELRVIRLTDLDRMPTDWSDLPAALEGRLDGRVSHLEVEREFPAFWRETIRLAFGLRPIEVMQVGPPLDLRFVMKIAEDGPAAAKLAPVIAHRARRFTLAPFKCIDRGDVVLIHPYQSYEAVEAFADAAAKDPAVTAIRATLYRVGEDNVLASSLITAARAGKDVAVLLEGRARFDELTNMEWALRFRSAGVRVLRLPFQKVHAKLYWAERGGRAYLHVGTGNYHPTNGRLYSDFSMFTCNARLTADAKSFFDALEGGFEPTLGTMRTGLAIRELLLERLRAESHPRGHAILKFNHLTDQDILSAVEACGRGGARVDLIIRTTLTKVSPAVQARSIVGRFLEHSRVVAFRRGGEWELWCGSFDAMPRNFERRYELMFPVEDPAAKEFILRELRSQLRDDVNAYELHADGTEKPRWGGSHDCQRLDARHATGKYSAVTISGLDRAAATISPENGHDEVAAGRVLPLVLESQEMDEQRPTGSTSVPGA
jgi:polyphosphate kinase